MESRLRLQKEVLERIVSGATLVESLSLLALGVETQLGDAVCSVLLLDQDGIRLMHGAAPNLPTEYCRIIDGIRIGPFAGSCGTAAYRREPVVVEDIATDPLWNDFRDYALPHGLRSCWSTPILDGRGQVLGTFAIYHRVPTRPPSDYQEITELATSIAVLAITKHRSEIALAESEQRYSYAMEATEDGVWDWDVKSGAVYFSPQWQRLLGYLPGEIQGRVEFFYNALHPEDAPRIAAVLDDHFAGRLPLKRDEIRLRTKSGSYRWFLDRGCVVERDQEGRPIRMVGTITDITERKHVEAALRASEGRLREAQNISRLGNFHWDAHTHRVVWSDQLYRIYGHEPGTFEPTFDTYLAAVHGDDRTRVLLNLRQAMRKDGRFDHDYRAVLPDGSVRWVHARGLANIDDDGQFGGLEGTCQDITERKVAEQANSRSVSLMQATLESTADGILVVDFEGRFVTYNQVFARMWRMSERLLAAEDDHLALQHAIEQLVDPEQFLAKVRHLYENPTEESFDTLDFKDGRVIERYSCPQMLDGKVAGRVWSFRDVTAAKRAEESLRWRTALFEALVESALDGILVVDRTGRKILQNQRMSEVWRIPSHLAAQEDNQAQFEFIASRTRNPGQFADRVAYLYSHPTEVSQDEVELVDGTILDRYSAPVLGKDDRYYGRIWTFRDITAQRHLEQQFRQSQKMEAFGQLAGGVAHDFNNVLAATLLEVEIMESAADLPAAVREGLEQIRTSTERAASLTRQLLLFSRRQVLQTVNLDVNEVVADLAKMLQRIIGEDLELVLSLTSRPLRTRADRGMIEQVLMNLAVNARDAMPQGGRLTIETREWVIETARDSKWPDAEPGHYLLLAVTDTGTGISPEIMPRIFDPFFTTKDVGKGTGLGLATVFGIVKQHRGWILVSNQAAGGVRFEILLPTIAGATPTSDPASAPTVRARGSETILLVEDEAALRRPIRAVLQQQGYRVLEAANAAEALTVWQRERKAVELLFTDLVMPGINGQQLARQLQADKPGLKVIFTSGYSTGMAGRELELQRSERFVQKPMRPEQLLDAVRASLDER